MIHVDDCMEYFSCSRFLLIYCGSFCLIQAIYMHACLRKFTLKFIPSKIMYTMKIIKIQR